MAKGRSWRTRLWLVLALAVYAALVAANILPNPFVGVWEWINRERPIAPDLAWQERIGGRPSSVIPAGTTVAVGYGGAGAQLRDRDTGDLIVPADPGDWRAGWVAVAGTGDDAVVVTGERLRAGYEVRDPDTGVVIYGDEDAEAVWTYRDALVDLRCASPRMCELRRYPPGSGEPRWSVELPGKRAGLLGANPQLAGGRTLTAPRIADELAGPKPIAPLIGFPIDREQLLVLETATGEVVAELAAERDEKIMVIGGRVIRSTSTRRNGVCAFEVTGHDAVTGARVWGPEPYHLQSGGAGCNQSDAPVAAGAAMAAIGPAGTELVVDAYDGRVLWSGEAGERVASLSEEVAVIRAADPTVRYAVTLGGGGERRWEATVSEDAGAVLARCGVVVADRGADRVSVLDSGTGSERLSVRTSARVVGCAPDGLLLADGRSVGFARFGDAAGVGGVEPDGDPDGPAAPK